MFITVYHSPDQINASGKKTELTQNIWKIQSFRPIKIFPVQLARKALIHIDTCNAFYCVKKRIIPNCHIEEKSSPSAQQRALAVGEPEEEC